MAANQDRKHIPGFGTRSPLVTLVRGSFSGLLGRRIGEKVFGSERRRRKWWLGVLFIYFHSGGFEDKWEQE